MIVFVSKWMIVFLLAWQQPAPDPILILPPRPGDAPGAAEVAREIIGFDLEAREERLFEEISSGNVPSWLRTLKPIQVTREIDGREHRVIFWVTPDYLAVGSDDDYLLIPLSPQTAQRIADLVGATLPTPLIVDAIWSAAIVQLPPSPIEPSDEMTTLPVFVEHNQIVFEQRKRLDVPTGSLTAGHKKDVVISNKLAREPGKVAIYGWHCLDGKPIQPLYTGHTDRWVDYSHGVRLVSRYVLVNNTEREITEVLSDEKLAPLLSDEGTIAQPRYPTRLLTDRGN